MRVALVCLALLAFAASSLQAQTSPAQPAINGGDFSSGAGSAPLVKVPTGVILVKGAWSSASDSVTPVPEGGAVSNNVFSNAYFGIRYDLPAGWMQKYEGPPPSDSGRYVLAQLRPGDGFKGQTRGNVLITAQDMFFTLLPARNAIQFVNYSKDNLEADYKLEQPPTNTKVAGRPFVFFAYWSPVAQLHWYVLSTEIRCHTIQIVLTSRDTKLLESLLLDLDKMSLPAETDPAAGTGGGDVPVCVNDYARDQDVLSRVDPVFTDRKFNPVPVRIIIDKTGKVKHVHVLSAFPDQAKAVTDALMQWKFKPYMLNGKPVEVETGIMFGQGQALAHSRATATD